MTRSIRALLVVAALACLAVPAAAHAATFKLTANVVGREVDLKWGATGPAPVITRDGVQIAQLDRGVERYADTAPALGHTSTYQVTLGKRSAQVQVALPAYFVGAATEDITPDGDVNFGGFGLGDGTVVPNAIVGRGGFGHSEGQRIRARAIVFDDGTHRIAIANIETQGMFAKYEDGPYGLVDIADQVAKDTGGALPADHILVASDHTHSGPDTIGAWGGVPDSYLKYIHDQTVKAIEEAFASRTFADVRAGHSDAPDLIYNQSCSEALNQSKQPDYTGPSLCATPGKDGEFRVVQATGADGNVLATLVAYAAHATAGGAGGLHGDWPQFLGDTMASTFGGVGMAMEGANGGTQPCRPACSFTNPSNPGYNVADRRTALMLNYMAHVNDALAHAAPVRGEVAAAQTHIREAITSPTVLGLFEGGAHIGAKLLRSHENPWMVGNTISTITSALRVGGVLFAGTPGEGFPAIGQGVRDNVAGAQEVLQLGLANDQLGYLIAPISYVPVIAAEVPVNDNIIFNVSPTIGDHVMCSDISLALKIGFTGSSPATCAPYDAADSAGDPVSNAPVGGVVLP